MISIVINILYCVFRVLEMEQQANELKDQNNELQQEVEMLKKKCVTANIQYTSLETGYDEKITYLNVEMSKLKSELLNINNQKDDLQRQVKYIVNYVKFRQLVKKIL